MKKYLENFLIWMAICILYLLAQPIIFLFRICGMSKKHKRKHLKIKKTEPKQETRREPVAVMETVTHTSLVSKSKLTMYNVWPGKKFRVICKPVDWDGDCKYVGMIGVCESTNAKYGARLKFEAGTSMTFPFSALEIVADTTNGIKEAVIGRKYKLVNKPPQWKVGCRFIDRTGTCVQIKEGKNKEKLVRLNFLTGESVDFPFDCVDEVPSIELNAREMLSNRKDIINENTIVTGEYFRVIKKPEKFGKEAEKLVGKVGRAKWANYHGVCLKFSDASGYVIEFDAIERYTPVVSVNPVKEIKLSASTCIIHRKYKLIKYPDSWKGEDKDLVGQIGKVLWASCTAGGAMVLFQAEKSVAKKVVPFECLEELPRPSEAELIDLIKQKPEKILRIIKGLSKITRLRPVKDFVEKGILPEVKPPENPPGPVVDEEDTRMSEQIKEELAEKAALIGPILPNNVIDLNAQNPS